MDEEASTDWTPSGGGSEVGMVAASTEGLKADPDQILVGPEPVAAELFIFDLSSSKDLKMFEHIGEVVYSRFLGPTTMSADGDLFEGSASIRYKHADDAKKALEKFNGMRSGDRTMTVVYVNPSSNIFVKGFPRWWSTRHMEATFSPHGRILGSRILYSLETGRSKRKGFVWLQCASEAKQAIAKLNGASVTGPGGELLFVSYAAQPRPPPDEQSTFHGGQSSDGAPRRATLPSSSGPTTAQAVFPPAWVGPTFIVPWDGIWVLLVRGLGCDVSEQDLWQVFGQYGFVQTISIERHAATTNAAGYDYGFVTMLQWAGACLAVSSLNGYPLRGQPLQVSFVQGQTSLCVASFGSHY